MTAVVCGLQVCIKLVCMTVLSGTVWCIVAQGRFGGVEDTAADWHHPREEPTHQTGARQPSRFCSAQRNVSIKQIPKSYHWHVFAACLLMCGVSDGNGKKFVNAEIFY